METIIAALVGLAFGGAAQLLARPQHKVGTALFPAIGLATAVAYWALASALGALAKLQFLSPGRPFVWIGLVLVVAAVVVPAMVTLPRRRAADDKDLFDRLSHVGRAEL